MASRSVFAYLGLFINVVTLILMSVTLALLRLNSASLDVSTFQIAVGAGAIVGAILTYKRPENPVSWFISIFALAMILGEFGRQYAIFSLYTDPRSLPLTRLMAWFPYWIWFTGIYMLIVFVPLYFPTGKLISPRWRPIAWLGGLFWIASTVLTAFGTSSGEVPGLPNPMGFYRMSPAMGQFLGVAYLASWIIFALLGVAGLVWRYYRSSIVERQQIKLFVATMSVFILVGIVSTLVTIESAQTLLDALLGPMILINVWIAIAIAILRYRLFDIDVVIRKAVVYGMLSLLLGLIYFSIIILGQQLFTSVSGQHSTVAVVLSTLLIAALFLPLRRRIQGFIDRRFYRRKYNAEKVLAAFAATARDETDLDSLTAELLRVIQETMEPEHVSLWLKPAADGRQTTVKELNAKTPSR